MNGRYHHTHVTPALAEEFMDTFTRLEYSLKGANFVDGGGGGVSAAWDRFANAIDNAFCDSPDGSFQRAVTLLLAEPARKQVLIDNALGFRPLQLDPNQTKAQRTLLVVRAVRNNLEHGGKIQLDGEREEGRNERLVTASLTVLKTVAGLNQAVHTIFLSSGKSVASSGM